MADDVAHQEEGITSLHLRILRKEWRVVCLQLVASLALIWLFLTMTRVFGHCHPDYVAKINDDNKFPIKKFGELAKHLKEKKIAKKFFIPKPCSIETLSRVHSKEYISNIS